MVFDKIAAIPANKKIIRKQLKEVLKSDPLKEINYC